MGMRMVWEEPNLPKTHQPRLGHPQDERGWREASLGFSECQPHAPVALLALPHGITPLAPPRTLQAPEEKKCCGKLSLSPIGAKTPKWRGLGFLPYGTRAEPPIPNITEIFQFCYLFTSTQHSPNFPEDKACPTPNDARGWKYERENRGGCSRCSPGPSPGCARWLLSCFTPKVHSQRR